MLSADAPLSPSPALLDRLAIGYLGFPLFLFLIGWFEWWAAIPLVAFAGYALKSCWGASPRAVPGRPICRAQIAVAIGVGCVWALMGGADHVVFANADWHVRDAVLHDLVESHWPVGYGLFDGNESMLRAPVAFYLPAALLGKWLGLAVAHAALGLWTAIGASLFLLQVLSLVPARTAAMLAVVAIVVSFSGMDIVGNLLNDGPRFRSDWNITTHLEWWAGKFQYSSMTTQLFWVPNHALGGWISIGLLYRNRGSTVLDPALPMLVVLNALWSPLTAIGLVPFVMLEMSSNTITRARANASAWSSAAIVGAVVALYLGMDPGKIPKGLAMSGDQGTPYMDLLQQVQFFLLEAGFIGAAILALQWSMEVFMALVILALLPLVHLGPNNDLVMRASIPSLAVLAIGACLALIGHVPTKNELRNKLMLLSLLVVGTMTPIAELARAILLPAWPVNGSATLIGVNCGSFPPHYIARLGDDWIGRMLKLPVRLEIGSVGVGACHNPALELMWSRGAQPSPEMRGLSRTPKK